MTDEDGYPTEDILNEIRQWQANDLPGLMQYVNSVWKYADCGFWTEEADEYHISTGGWSGNEEVIGAMMDNLVWWMLFWKASFRGGHYVFSRMHP